MPNLYPPKDLKIKLIVGDTVMLTWDIPNAIEFKPGMRCKIYVSADGSTYTLHGESKRPEYSLQKIPEHAYVRVTTYLADLGESSPCQALQILSPVTVAEYQEAVPVGVDSSGKSRYLAVDEATGRLKVMAEISSPDLANISTEAKQDSQIALLQTISSFSVNNASTRAKQDEIILRLSEQTALLDRIDTNTKVGNLVISETELNSVPASIGTKITLPFFKRAKIEQLTVIHEFGTAAAFTAKIWRKKISSSERDVVAKFDSYKENRLDVIRTIPYISLDGTDEITVQVIPDIGTSNIFFVRISGTLAY